MVYKQLTYDPESRENRAVARAILDSGNQRTDQLNLNARDKIAPN